MRESLAYQDLSLPVLNSTMQLSGLQIVGKFLN